MALPDRELKTAVIRGPRSIAVLLFYRQYGRMLNAYDLRMQADKWAWIITVDRTGERYRLDDVDRTWTLTRLKN